MSETASATVTYTPLESGNEESRWIRLEQVQATLPSPSVGYMAEIIDLVFGIEACDDGMGGGGEQAGGGPTEEELAETLSIVLADAGQCRLDHWLAAVNVYRTHERPGYELRSETATVERVEPVEESHQQVVDVDGPLIALERPYAGSLTGIPKGVGWTVRGGTVNLDRPVRDRLTLRYQTKYERVTLRVPTRQTPPTPTLPPQAGGGQGGGSEEYEPAAVVAFWGDMAAECELEPPEPESEEDRQAREDICRKRRPEPQEPGGCWKVIKHYQRCECDYNRVNEWEEQEPAPCDGYRAGAGVGIEERFDGYVRCEGEEEHLHDPEFYKRRCCKYPEMPSRLPRCREMRRVYRGGHEIESGPEHWKNIYGENVIMRPVLPEGGVCGDEITRWNVPQKNCCDGVAPLVPSPDNPTNIEPGATYLVKVGGGKQGDLDWRSRGGIKFEETGTTEYRTGSRAVRIVTDEGVCPNPVITVNDGCNPLVMNFQGPDAEPPALPDDMTVSSGQQFQVAVSGGVPGYMWQVGGGLELLGWSADGGQAFLKTPNDPLSWCVGEITVVDACGSSASMSVYNGDRGRWQQIDQFDPCNVPGMPFPPDGAAITGRWSMPRNGHRVYYAQDGSVDIYGHSCPTTNLRCPGGMVVDINAEMASRCVSNNNYYRVYDWSNSCCKSTHRRRPTDMNSTRYGSYAQQVQKWVCG